LIETFITKIDKDCRVGGVGQRDEKGEGERESEAPIESTVCSKHTTFYSTRISKNFVPFVPYSKVLLVSFTPPLPLQ